MCGQFPASVVTPRIPRPEDAPRINPCETSPHRKNRSSSSAAGAKAPPFLGPSGATPVVPSVPESAPRPRTSRAFAPHHRLRTSAGRQLSSPPPGTAGGRRRECPPTAVDSFRPSATLACPRDTRARTIGHAAASPKTLRDDDTTGHEAAAADPSAVLLEVILWTMRSCG